MRARWWILAVILMLWSGQASTQTVVQFSHRNTPNGQMAGGYEFANGEEFQVQIIDTEPKVFECEVTGIEIVAQGSRETLSPPTNTITKTIEHKSKYGGYIVRVSLIKKKERPAGLDDKIWYISVRTRGWHTELSAGLFGTGLVNEQYYLETGDDGLRRVIRDEDAEDDLVFGFASFATVFHDRHEWFGGSLGLGIDSNNLRVMLGPTLRLGDHASLTLGYNWGKIDSLPAGTFPGSVFESDNLSLTPTTNGDWFFSVSIRGFTDKAQKAFAEEAQKKTK
jgi:hypothetical protein